MRTLRTFGSFGIFRSMTATGLLLASIGTASAMERSAGPHAASLATHPLPRFAALLTFLQAPAPKPKPAKTSLVVLPPGEGHDTTKKLCSTCHGTDVFARQRHTKEKWNQILDNMVSKGMEASDDDLEKMADYLGAHLGPESPVPAPSGQAAATTPASGEPSPKAEPQHHK